MTTLSSFNKTDLVDDHTASDVNKLIAASFYSEFKNVETLSADRTLEDVDTPIQRLDPGGADRVVKMPTAAATTNHPFVIYNAADAAETITVKNNGGTVTLVTLTQGMVGLLLPDGAGGYAAPALDSSAFLAASGLTEWSEQGSDPSTPASAKWKVYFKSGGLYIIDDAGTVTGPITAGTASDLVSPLVSAEISITGAATATLNRMHVCSGSADYTVTLPATSGNAGKWLGFRFTNTGVTTLDGNASELVEGETTLGFRQGNAAFLLCDGTNWYLTHGMVAPRSQVIFADEMVCSTALSTVLNAAQRYGYYRTQTSPADAQTFDMGVFLKKGTYTATVLGATYNSNGKADWTLGSVSQTTGQDWYSAGITYSVEKTFTLTVLSSGYHRLRATLNGKNGSSSGYNLLITAVILTPSAY